MERDIIGVDIEIEYADGTKSKGHLSPDGVHMRRDEDNPRARWALTEMREGIEAAFRPYRKIGKR